MDNKYNGWTNRATWLVNLWLGDNFQMDAEEGITIDADYIRDCIDDMLEDEIHAPSGFIQDLIGGALAEVNYYELAEHYITEEVSS